MPDKKVKTIQGLIFYQYAKIIAKSSFRVPDGQAAKRERLYKVLCSSLN